MLARRINARRRSRCAFSLAASSVGWKDATCCASEKCNTDTIAPQWANAPIVVLGPFGTVDAVPFQTRLQITFTAIPPCGCVAYLLLRACIERARRLRDPGQRIWLMLPCICCNRFVFVLFHPLAQFALDVTQVIDRRDASATSTSW